MGNASQRYADAKKTQKHIVDFTNLEFLLLSHALLECLVLFLDHS